MDKIHTSGLICLNKLHFGGDYMFTIRRLSLFKAIFNIFCIIVWNYTFNCGKY